MKIRNILTENSLYLSRGGCSVFVEAGLCSAYISLTIAESRHEWQ